MLGFTALQSRKPPPPSISHKLFGQVALLLCTPPALGQSVPPSIFPPSFSVPARRGNTIPSHVLAAIMQVTLSFGMVRRNNEPLYLFSFCFFSSKTSRVFSLCVCFFPGYIFYGNAGQQTIGAFLLAAATDLTYAVRRFRFFFFNFFPFFFLNSLAEVKNKIILKKKLFLPVRA